MNASSENNWDFVEENEDNPFADQPFQAQSEDSPQAKSLQADSVETANADAEEAKRRAAHEAAEDQREAEFNARKEAKQKAIQEQINRVGAMTNEEAMNAAIQRTGADTEKLVRRNMKEMVTEYIQTLCIEDSAFARLTLHPRKSMIRCFQYINRKAFEYVQDEMKDNGITPGAPAASAASK